MTDFCFMLDPPFKGCSLGFMSHLCNANYDIIMWVVSLKMELILGNFLLYNCCRVSEAGQAGQCCGRTLDFNDVGRVRAASTTEAVTGHDAFSMLLKRAFKADNVSSSPKTLI